jgi:Response regulator containing CheY-like receiver, AAA-type ATPase, and DNA-binding domains
MDLPNIAPTVVLMEDDAAVRSAMALCLEFHGLHVVTASTDLDLAQLIATRGLRPALIIADYQLGSKTVFDVMPNVISGTDAKVIVTTGDILPEIRAQVEACGWRLLSKPYHPEEIMSCIEGHKGQE